MILFALKATDKGSGLNLAACHACCVVPDLACSTLPKNIFLDRSVLVGNQENAKGYF